MDGLNKNLEDIEDTVYIANGGAEATNNFQRNMNDGYAFVTLTTMYKIWGQSSN